MKNQKIKCFKYNNSFEDDTCFYAATLKLSKNEKKIIIMNKKEIINRKYTGTTDPKEANIATQVYNNEKKVT